MTTAVSPTEPLPMVVLPATIRDPSHRFDMIRLVAVDDPDVGEVVAVWKGDRRKRTWYCSYCRTNTALALCRHTYSAGLLLAEHLLGLTRMPELQPTTPATRKDHP